MNKNSFLGALLLTSAFSLYAAEDVKVMQFRHAGPVEVRMPILADTLNVDGKKFEVKDLLNAGLSVAEMMQSAQVLQADTAGYVTLATPRKAYDLHLFSFYLKSERYVKGTLEVSGPGMFEVYVNGEKKGSKTTVNESLDKAGSASVDMKMEPYRYQVVVKYLASDSDKCAPAVKARFKTDADVQVTATLSPEKSYSLKNIMDGKNFYGASLSPNGKYAIIKYYETFPGGKSSYYTEVTDPATGRIILSTDGEAKSVSWMPKSNLMYYTRQGAKGRELVTINPENLKENVLGKSLPEGGFSFSPDESFLLFTVREEGPKEGKDLLRVIEPDDRQPGWRNRYFIHRYTLTNGFYERLTFGHTSTSLNDVSADSRYLLFSTSERELTSRPFSRGSLYRLDLQTMKVDTIWQHEKFLYGAQFSPDGKQLLVQAPGEAFNGIGLNIKKGQTSNTYDGQLFLMDIDSKKVTPLTKDFNPAIVSATWNKYDNRIYLTAEDMDYQRIFRLDPSSGKFTALQTGEDVISGSNLAENAPEMIYYGQSISNSNRLYTYDLKTDKYRMLQDLSKERMEDVKLGEAHDWNFDYQGTTITGRYYLPPNFDANKKYPMIVYYYGGTSPTNRALESRYSMHMFAALGYVVYTLNPSGTTGFGQEFAARHVNAWGKVTAEEIIKGTELFCKEHAFVNKDKIGCIGASYGGFMTQYLQTRTKLFAAAISHAGISSIASYWGEGYWGYSYSQGASANSYPWNNPDLYTKQSPLYNADKINTPLLLLHGNADTNVPVGESIQMFTALKLLGKTVEFVQVDGENHGIVGYDKRIGWNNTIFAWFAKWLQDSPAWWKEMYPERNL